VAAQHEVDWSIDQPRAEAAQPLPSRSASAARWAWEWTRSLLGAFTLFLFIRTFLVEAFRIPTGSMENTLLVGDFLLVNKAVFGPRVPFSDLHLPAVAEPRRGDVIVFVPPHEPEKNCVKRLVAVPGDTVEMRDKQLFINGVPQSEPYARFSDEGDIYDPGMTWQCDFLPAGIDTRECRPTRDNWGPIVVPDARYMVLGDNRDDSEDSRYWGFVDRSSIKGKPLFIYYSFNAASMRVLPWIREIRWNRIGGAIS